MKHKSINQTLETDAKILTNITAYIVRSSFWAVLIVGIADFIISFLVVEKLAEPIFNEAIKIDSKLARAYAGRAFAKHKLNEIEGACADIKTAKDLGFDVNKLEIL